MVLHSFSAAFVSKIAIWFYIKSKKKSLFNGFFKPFLNVRLTDDKS
nr:MAG TPA: hypothetical protein [Caudoviricetes sp.]